MMVVHASADIGFSRNSESYVAGRPDYPEAIVAWLRDDLGLGADRRVLDLGAGTGKFVPLLKATGAKVIAVEPVAAMRDKLCGLHPDVEALAGAADGIPLPDAAVDAVVCAQAFHWFATTAALREIHRVLRPGGVLGLVWNERDGAVPWVEALFAITRAYVGDTPDQKTGLWRRLFPAEGFDVLHERRFPHQHTGSPEHVIVERILSISYIAALPAAE